MDYFVREKLARSPMKNWMRTLRPEDLPFCAEFNEKLFSNEEFKAVLKAITEKCSRLEIQETGASTPSGVSISAINLEPSLSSGVSSLPSTGSSQSLLERKTFLNNFYKFTLLHKNGIRLLTDEENIQKMAFSSDTLLRILSQRELFIKSIKLFYKCRTVRTRSYFQDSIAECVGKYVNEPEEFASNSNWSGSERTLLAPKAKPVTLSESVMQRTLNREQTGDVQETENIELGKADASPLQRDTSRNRNSQSAENATDLATKNSESPEKNKNLCTRWKQWRKMSDSQSPEESIKLRNPLIPEMTDANRGSNREAFSFSTFMVPAAHANESESAKGRFSRDPNRSLSEFRSHAEYTKSLNGNRESYTDPEPERGKEGSTESARALERSPESVGKQSAASDSERNEAAAAAAKWPLREEGCSRASSEPEAERVTDRASSCSAASTVSQFERMLPNPPDSFPAPTERLPQQQQQQEVAASSESNTLNFQTFIFCAAKPAATDS